MQQPTLPGMAKQWQSTLGWQPSPDQQSKFQHLYEAILEGNRQFNLTRILEPEEFWEKHLWDSLNGIRGFLETNGQDEEAEGAGQQSEAGDRPPVTSATADPKPPSKVIDIGTGAGFPGVPVAIVQPTWYVTLLDSTRKKMAFLETVIQNLTLPNTRTWVDRVEQVGHHAQHREVYDLALIRAVANPSVCAEYALPLLRVGGVAILYRGQWTEEEELELEQATTQLGGTIESVVAAVTPLSQSVRHCVYLRKTKPTHPQFPRGVGIPTQKPL